MVAISPFCLAALCLRARQRVGTGEDDTGSGSGSGSARTDSDPMATASQMPSTTARWSRTPISAITTTTARGDACDPLPSPARHRRPTRRRWRRRRVRSPPDDRRRSHRVLRRFLRTGQLDQRGRPAHLAGQRRRAAPNQLDKPYQLVRDDNPNLGTVFVDARVRVNALSAGIAMRRSTGIVLGYDDPEPLLLLRARQPGPAPTSTPASSTRTCFGTPQYDYAPGEFAIADAGDWLTMQARTRVDGATTSIECHDPSRRESAARRPSPTDAAPAATSVCARTASMRASITCSSSRFLRPLRSVRAARRMLLVRACSRTRNPDPKRSALRCRTLAALPQPSIVDVDPEEPSQLSTSWSVQRLRCRSRGRGAARGGGGGRHGSAALESPADDQEEADLDEAARDLDIESDPSIGRRMPIRPTPTTPAISTACITPPAEDRDLDLTPDRESYRRLGPGENWLETLDKKAAESGARCRGTTSTSSTTATSTAAITRPRAAIARSPTKARAATAGSSAGCVRV